MAYDPQSDPRSALPDRRQLLVLSIIFLAAAAALGFLALGRNLDPRGAGAVDSAVLRFFRLPDQPERLRGPQELLKVTRDLTSLGGTPVLTLVVFVFAGYLALKGRYRLLILLLAATLGGVLLTVGLKSFFARPRPTVVPALMIETSRSFPSGHSSMSTVVYLTIGVILGQAQDGKGLRIYLVSIALLVSLLIGVTRVMLGVHYPTDVLAGWCLGLAWACICWFAALLVRRSTRGSRRSP